MDENVNYYNLDDVVPEDKQIEIRGVVYKVPAEVTMDIMLRVLKYGQELQKNPADPEANEKALQSLFDIFLIRQPDLKFEEFKSIMTIKQYARLIEIVFGDQAEKKTS